MSAAHYRLNAPFVASQVIDGEVILINFESGAYYSAGQAGAALIARIEAEQPVEAIVAELARAHAAEPGVVAPAVESFVAELTRESLIVPVEDGASAAAPAEALSAPTGPFEAPQLQKFDDLQDILLLDPIHDGDQPAWPVTPQGSNGSEPGTE